MYLSAVFSFWRTIGVLKREIRGFSYLCQTSYFAWLHTLINCTLEAVHDLSWMPRNAEWIISSWEQVAAVLQVEGNHADVCLPGFIKALVFTCHTRVPARVMTCTVAITTLECRGHILLSVYLLACVSLPWVCFCVRRWLSGQLHNRTYLWLDLAKIHPLKSVYYSVSHKQMPVEAIHFQTTRQCPQISPQHLPACWFYYLMILICCFILHALMSAMCTSVSPLYVPVLSELS